MAVNIELYEAFKDKVGTEAAALLANSVPAAANLAEKEDIHALGAQVREDVGGLELKIEGLRGEIEGVRGEIHGEIQGVRGEIQSVRGEIQGVRGELMAEIKDTKAEMMRWMLGFFVPLWLGVYGTLAAVLVTVLVKS